MIRSPKTKHPSLSLVIGKPRSIPVTYFIIDRELNEYVTNSFGHTQNILSARLFYSLQEVRAFFKFHKQTTPPSEINRRYRIISHKVKFTIQPQFLSSKDHQIK